MVIKLEFGGITLYAERRYDPETQRDIVVLMDEAELKRQEALIREYLRRLKE